MGEEATGALEAAQLAVVAERVVAEALAAGGLLVGGVVHRRCASSRPASHQTGFFWEERRQQVGACRAHVILCAELTMTEASKTCPVRCEVHKDEKAQAHGVEDDELHDPLVELLQLHHREALQLKPGSSSCRRGEASPHPPSRWRVPHLQREI